MPKLNLRDFVKRFGMWIGFFVGVCTTATLAGTLIVVVGNVSDLQREQIKDKHEIIAMREELREMLREIDGYSDALLKAEAQALITQERYTNMKFYTEMNCRGK